VTDNPMAAIYDAEYYAGRGKSAYDDYALCRGIVRDMAALIDAVLQPASAFDAGAAYGFAVEWWRERGRMASGCDVSAFAVGQAAGRVYRHDLLQPIPEPDGLWDVVVCTECMEHIVEDRVDAVLRELVRVAGRAAILLVALGDGRPDPGDVSHVTMWPRTWWETRFAERGIRRLADAEAVLNGADLSRRMHWDGRWFVLDAGAVR
jgi:hypothetical protein